MSVKFIILLIIHIIGFFCFDSIIYNIPYLEKYNPLYAWNFFIPVGFFFQNMISFRNAIDRCNAASPR